MKKIILALFVFSSITSLAQFNHQRVYTTFDNLSLEKADTFYNGSDRNGGFSHYGRNFPNDFDTTWGTWSGWSYSNMTDGLTPGFINQYSAKKARGVSATKQYAVAYKNTYITFDEATEISGAYFTNTTYAYDAILNGSNFNKKFGGVTGNDSDFYMLTVTCYLEGSEVSSEDLYLADYRFADNSKDYILDDWTYFDFNGINGVEDMMDSITFQLSSTDTSKWGLNNPAYFAMDDLNAYFGAGDFNYVDKVDFNLPNDSFYNGDDGAGGIHVLDRYFFPNNYNQQWNSWTGWSMSSKYDKTTPGFGNQYSSIFEHGTGSFFLSYGRYNEVYGSLDTNASVIGYFGTSFYISNSTYAYYDMLNGSQFSKKFGGPTGNDPDYFRVIVNYWDKDDNLLQQDSVYLADYRFVDNSKDFIRTGSEQIYTYEYACVRMSFELQSSDTSAYGINTPNYFCLDLYVDFESVDDIPRNEIKVFPNPSKETIVVNSELAMQEVVITGLNGQEVLREPVNGTIFQTNVSQFPSGFYVVQVFSKAGVSYKKLIVE